MKHVRSLLCASALASLTFASGDAAAIELGTPAREHPFRSAQNFALEFRFSPYYPAVDDEPSLNGKTPFKDRFGDNPRLAFGVEFDWQVLRIPFLGTLGPGLGAHIVGMSRPAKTTTGRDSGDNYSLDIYPIYLSAVLRADTFWRELGFPLVPYGKVGLGWAPWRASNTAGRRTLAECRGKGRRSGRT